MNNIAVDFVTKVIEVEFNDTKADAMAAQAAINSAAAASASASAAAASCAQANSVAGALTDIYNQAIESGTVVAPAIDKTLNITGAAADAKIVGNVVGGYRSLAALPRYAGGFNQTGTWAYTASSFTHVVMPVIAGDEIEITATATGGQTFLAFVRSYAAPVLNASLDFSTQPGFTASVGVLRDSTIVRYIPDDVNFVVIMCDFSTPDLMTPQRIKINGEDYTGGMIDALNDSYQELRANLETIKSLAEMEPRAGFLNGDSEWDYLNTTVDSMGFHVLIPVRGGESLHIEASSGVGTYYAAFSKYDTPVAGSAPSFASGWARVFPVLAGSSAEVSIPVDAKYLYVACKFQGTSIIPAALIIDGYDYAKSVQGNSAHLVMTLADYDAMAVHDPNTLYFITEA